MNNYEADSVFTAEQLPNAAVTQPLPHAAEISAVFLFFKSIISTQTNEANGSAVPGHMINTVGALLPFCLTGKQGQQVFNDANLFGFSSNESCFTEQSSVSKMNRLDRFTVRSAVRF